MKYVLGLIPLERPFRFRQLNVTLLTTDKNASNTLVGGKEWMGRSLAKTLSWRVIGTLDTILICWVISGEIAFAISIGGIELVSKMILYFFHERLWGRITWGTRQKRGATDAR